MVTAHSAAQAGSDRDNQHLIGIACTKNIAHYRNKNSKGAPACTSRERQEHCNHEDNRRQEHFQDTCGAGNNVMHVEFCTQKASHAGKSPSHRQNHNRRNHSSKACRNAVCEILECHHITHHIEAEGEEEGRHTAQHQTFRSIRAGKSINKAFTSEKSASINHADNAAENKHHDRQNKVDNSTIGLISIVLIITIGTSSRGKQIALNCIILMYLHAAEIKFQHCNHHHHRQGTDSIEVVRNCL